MSALADSGVTIVGLGLMGGSLALALRGRCREIVGVDCDPEAIAFACAHAVIDREADFMAALDSDLLVLAAPIRAILGQLDQLSRLTFHVPRSTVVLDLGSTKGRIVAAMQALPPGFEPLGGHPLCGKEVSGIANAEASLYQGKTFVLTPLARTSPAALALAHELIAAIGATALVLPADRHDALVAVTSHLPYAAAVALVRTALYLDDEQLGPMMASGFRDTSRLGASDLTIMTDILLTNRAAILDALARYRVELDSLIGLIDRADPDALRSMLAPTRAARAGMFTTGQRPSLPTDEYREGIRK